MRPFLRSAKVIPRGCSRALQRAIADFAADQPFAQVRTKLQEHYGFAIGESTIQKIALGHAKNIFEASRVIPVFPETPGKHKDIIAQTDGGMVPLVEPDARQEDKRKGKTLAAPARSRRRRPRVAIDDTLPYHQTQLAAPTVGPESIWGLSKLSLRYDCPK